MNDSPHTQSLDLSIVMPCLNEAKTLAGCINEAMHAIEIAQVFGEVIIADNGSTDQSRQIAIDCGARVADIPTKGYGSALRGGMAASRGEFILMGDCDGSYDFTHALRFLEKLRDGFDLVIGNRFQGGIESGAMPWSHRYLGNPVLSGLGRWWFQVPVGDFHCGLRAIRRCVIESLKFESLGMEFASEMVIKAALSGLRITEVPTTLRPDGRDRPPHLRTFRDGFRHLRLMANLGSKRRRRSIETQETSLIKRH